MSQLSLPWPLGSLVAAVGPLPMQDGGGGFLHLEGSNFLPFYTQGFHSRSMRIVHRVWVITLTNICFSWLARSSRRETAESGPRCPCTASASGFPAFLPGRPRSTVHP